MKLLALVVATAILGCASASPLYDYVHTPDPHYSYFDTGIRFNNKTDATWTGYLLNVTSQQWMNSSVISRPIWTHQLVVIVPKVLRFTDVAGLYITGGSNNGHIPSQNSEDILLSVILAETEGIITATLFQIPAAPIVFASDPTQKERGEDALVAYSWKMFLENQDNPEWIVFFPMVKAAVRALDTIADFAPKVAPSVDIKEFLVHGASKRGWTTWFVGAVDSRVKAMAPIVMDMLNFVEGVAHMYEAYGGWTFAFEDYWELNITEDLADPGLLDVLGQQIDPLKYKENLTLPTLVVDATGDEFFMPDDDWFWWGQLPGEKYRLMVANAEHSMATGLLTLIPGISAFYESILTDTPRPKFNWTMDHTTGDIHIMAETQPKRVVLRFATTSDGERRDFRLIKGDTPQDPCKFIPVKVFGTACINPVLWEAEDVAATSSSNGVYHYRLSQPLPPKGWRGFLGELHFDGPNGQDFIFTTQVSIIPNTFPFPKCSGKAQCKGFLV